MNARMNDPPSPFARAVGTAAAGLVVALIVLAFTYLLRMLDFGPLQELIAAEDQVYDAFRSPEIRLLPNAHQVVFIDIDDNAARKWSTKSNEDSQSPASPQSLPNNTPRGLIAELTKLARSAPAAVVYLDFDFRNRLRDDADLHAELAKQSKTPVLIPAFFTAGRLPPCDDQSDRVPPAELETAFSDLTAARQSAGEQALPSVALVHPVLTLGAYGLPEGACSAYHVRFGPGEEIVSREAAMVRAVELASAESPCAAEPCIKTPDLASPEIVPIRWTIGNETAQKYDSSENGSRNNGGKEKPGDADGDKRLAYARIKASLLVKYQSLIDSPKMDLGVLKDAIVVIGATAPWSEDTLSTPLGDLQGALAHVNLVLSLESSSDDLRLAAQFGLDVFFIIVAAMVTIPLCWLPTFKSVVQGARLPVRRRLQRVFLEAFVILVCGLLFAVVSWFLSRHWSVLHGWRFGILLFIVGTIVVLLIEFCSAVADGTEEAVEGYMMRRFPSHPKASRQPEPSTGKATESAPP